MSDPIIADAPVPTVKKVEVLKNVVSIEYETNCLAHVLITRGNNAEMFYETPVCINKCCQCGCVFAVFFKSGELRCPSCGGCVKGSWTSILANTWGKP